MTPLSPLSPLSPGAISARRRPAALLFVFAWELAWALVVATPVHAWARRVWGAHPDGDAVLWAPGARELLVWLGSLDAAESTVFNVTALLVLVGTMLAQIPLAILLTSLVNGRDEAGRAPSLADAQRGAAGTYLPLLTVHVAIRLGELTVLATGGFAARALDHALANSLGDALAARLAIALFALFVLLALALGVLGDLVRTSIAHDPSGSAWRSFVRAVKRAGGVGLRAFRSAFLAWAWRAAFALALVGLGALASQGLGGRGGLALLLLFVGHQGIVLARTALRASWLARAARLTAPASEPAADSP